MPGSVWFKDWFNSHYYHLLYQHRDEQEAIAFITRIIGYLHPAKDAYMLDVACGKGRHSKALADMGYDVTGIDLSEASIREAKLMESDHLAFYQHDMRLPFRIGYYHYAFNLFTSFGYFNTQREHDNAIRTIAQSLRLNGSFIIDYLNVHYAADHMQPTLTIDKGEVRFYISKWQDDDYFYKQIQITDATNQTPKHLYTEKVAKFSLGDFTDMMAYQGLQVQEVFGDYSLGHYDVKSSPRMIIHAKKI